MLSYKQHLVRLRCLQNSTITFVKAESLLWGQFLYSLIRIISFSWTRNQLTGYWKKTSKTRDLWSKSGGQCGMEERTVGRNQGTWWQIFINNLCGFRGNHFTPCASLLSQYGNSNNLSDDLGRWMDAIYFFHLILGASLSSGRSSSLCLYFTALHLSLIFIKTGKHHFFFESVVESL